MNPATRSMGAGTAGAGVLDASTGFLSPRWLSVSGRTSPWTSADHTDGSPSALSSETSWGTRSPPGHRGSASAVPGEAGTHARAPAAVLPGVWVKSASNPSPLLHQRGLRAAVWAA